ncbi:hypothetical protein CGC20_20215 [Leishmania donovani]|uniref:Uncharacterized protein n=1 Tax=Leishmania donovani TaxID=5661 RepID=A0A504XLS2_LEIDO|nr:hypothetical protein CGC20_20215 [Leishmania donovani]
MHASRSCWRLPVAVRREACVAHGGGCRALAPLTNFSRLLIPVMHVLLLGALLLTQSGSLAVAKRSRTSSSSSSSAPVSGDLQTLHTVTSCSECTINASQRWCPTTMRCYSASDCKCEGQTPCIDLNTCFYGSRPTCRECVESGGVYCRAGEKSVAATTATAEPVSHKPLIRCYAPTAASPFARADVGARGARSPLSSAVVAALDAALLTCSNATCRGGHCIVAAAECPAELVDPLTRCYEVIGTVLMTILMLLAAHSIWLLWSRARGF